VLLKKSGHRILGDNAIIQSSISTAIVSFYRAPPLLEGKQALLVPMKSFTLAGDISQKSVFLHRNCDNQFQK
jgi:hypothetical protein